MSSNHLFLREQPARAEGLDIGKDIHIYRCMERGDSASITSRVLGSLVPIFVIPSLLIVVPRAPPSYRAPIVGGTFLVYGGWSYYRFLSGTGSL